MTAIGSDTSVTANGNATSASVMESGISVTAIGSDTSVTANGNMSLVRQ